MIYRIALLDTIAVMRRDRQCDHRIVCGDTGQTGKGKVEGLAVDRCRLLIGEMHGEIQGANVLNLVMCARRQTGRGGVRAAARPWSNNGFTSYKILYKGGPMRIGLFQFERGRCGEHKEIPSCSQKNAPDGVKLGDLPS